MGLYDTKAPGPPAHERCGRWFYANIITKLRALIIVLAIKVNQGMKYEHVFIILSFIYYIIAVQDKNMKHKKRP